MNKIKLFCFPYAGGSALVYRKWKTWLNETIELVPVELAGRGTRVKEPLYGSCEAAVEDIYRMIRREIVHSPYALFGHSMGAVLVYELARKIRAMGVPPPLHLFFSGRRAPHIPSEKDKKIHQLDAEAFKARVIELGGTPPEFFQYPQLMEMFLPLLRHDFELSATEFNFETIDPFPVDVSVFLGKEEEITPDQADGWKRHTQGLCSIYYFNGGHFFINQEGAGISKLISKTLSSAGPSDKLSSHANILHSDAQADPGVEN